MSFDTLLHFVFFIINVFKLCWINYFGIVKTVNILFEKLLKSIVLKKKKKLCINKIQWCFW